MPIGVVNGVNSFSYCGLRMNHLSKWQALVVISKELLQCWIAALAYTVGMGGHLGSE